MTPNRSLVKIFEFALNQEETGKSFFQSSLKRMGVGAAVSAFKRLVAEEGKHIEFIRHILRGLKEGADIELPGNTEMDFAVENYFDARAKSEFLQQCIEESMVPDVTVFNTAWLIEKDLSDFYAKMAGQTEGKAQEALQMLSRWEKRHEAFFREYRDKLSEVYSRMPWGG